MLLRFPKRHARASAKLSKGSPSGRVINLASKSNVTPPAFPTGEVDIGNHQSAGMRSRCDHLRTAGRVAPMSDAIASREGQSSITARTESGAFMDDVLRHFVLERKPNMSNDCVPLASDISGMPKDSPTKYLEGFLSRTAKAREAAGYTQQELAVLLGLEQNLYSKYEVRSYLPHFLVPKFCLACRIDPAWLFTGRGAGPIAKPRTEKRGRPRKRVPKAA